MFYTFICILLPYLASLFSIVMILMTGMMTGSLGDWRDPGPGKGKAGFSA